MPLPKINTEAWQQEIDFFKTAGGKSIADRAKELGYAHADSYKRTMRARGIYKQKQEAPAIVEPKKETIVLPEVHLLKYKASGPQKGDEEYAILHASDGHAGKITKSFNKDVYRSRMGTMYESAMRIVSLHRNMYPIRKLLIFNTGDNNQGENPYQGSIIGEVECGARDQTKNISAPMWNDVLGSFAQEFETVDFYGVTGNHGKDKLAPATSAEDLRLYDILEEGIGNQENNITIHEPLFDDWYQIVEVFGFRCFLAHMDGIPCQQGVPLIAINRKLKSWHMQFGGFKYAFGGHFHKRHSDEMSSVLEFFMASTLVSDDNWALQKMGISSQPSQWIYGIHPRHGITWRYPLQVDYKYPIVEEK